MKKIWLSTLCLSLGLGMAAVGCGDDEDEDDADVSIDAPGVKVNAESLTYEGAAGSFATTVED